MSYESLNKKLHDLAAVQSQEFKLIMGALAKERDGSRKTAEEMAGVHSRFQEVQSGFEGVQAGLGEVKTGLENVRKAVETLAGTTEKIAGTTEKLTGELGSVKNRLQERADNFAEIEAGMGRYFQVLNEQVETVRSALPKPEPDGFDVRQEITKINERLDRLEDQPPAA